MFSTTGSTDTVWRSWVCETSSTTSTTGNEADPWSGWVRGGYCTTATGVSTTSNSTVWITWVDSANVLQEHQVKAKAESKKERKRRHREERARERQLREAARKQELEAEKQRKKREEAEEKAKLLLLDLIGEDELKRYEATGRVFVKGREFDYIVQKHGLVRRIEKDKIQDLCIHLQNRWKFPDTDNVVALKLLIEGDEKHFNRLANKHGSWNRPAELPEAACMGVR